MSEKIKFDAAQKAAINIERNAVVSAGAGSGKTSVLSSRFAHLVLDKKIKVDEILTLTFTKKATVEMYGRIYQTLNAADPKSVENFHEANIQTLDSYCTKIARLGCNFYGISPGFEVDEEAIAASVSSMALPFILKNKDKSGIKNLVQTRNLQDIAGELFVKPILYNSSIAFPLDFNDMLKNQMDVIITGWNRTGKIFMSDYADLQRALLDFEGNRGLKFYIALCETFTDDIPEFPEMSAAMFKDDCDKSEDAERFLSFMDFINKISLLKATGGKGLEVIKETFYTMRDKLIPELKSLLTFFFTYPLAKSIVPLMEEFQEMTNDLKRQESILTFKDVSNFALAILTDHPEIRAAEKEKYRAIMIDEFQDNNSMQRDLLFLLAEKPERMEKSVPGVDEICKDKLFFVGDEKQSIYRFRGADVSVFRALSDDFKDGCMELSTNYRSNAALIASFNTIFGGADYPPSKEKNHTMPSVFYKANHNQSEIPAYEAIYNDAELSDSARDEIAKMSGKTRDEFYSTKIHIALYDKSQEADDESLTDDAAEAQWTANKIRTLIEEKGVRPSDIAVLFRKYSLQSLWEKTFLENGIPYSTETVTGFFNSFIVPEIVTFLRLAAYPNERATYEKFLHSRFVSMSNEEADAILAMEQEPFTENAGEILSEESAARFTHAGEMYRSITQDLKTEKIASMVTKLWYDFGYRYETMWNQKVSMYSTLYDRIFELARRADEETTSLPDFVDGLRVFEDEMEKLENMDIPIEQTEGVRIMTIFKSKGLQFKYVFICGCGKGTRSETNSEAVYMSKTHGLSINLHSGIGMIDSAPNYFFNLAKGEEEKMESAELRRIVYVAITRAIEEVFISGCMKKMPDDRLKFLPEDKTLPKSTLDVLSPAIAYFTSDDYKGMKPFTFEDIPPQPQVPVESIENPKGKEESARHILSLMEKSVIVKKEEIAFPYIYPSSLVSSEVISTTEDESDAEEIPYAEIDTIIDSVKSGGTKKTDFSYEDFGSAAHAYIEAAMNKSDEEISERYFALLEGDAKKIQRLRKICVEMRDQFLKSETGKAALSSKWHRAEYAFHYKKGENIVNGKMDLVFRTEDGGYVIVDYKTNRHVHPAIYYEQLACYREALSMMCGCPMEKIRCVLYYLRWGKDVRVESGKLKVESGKMKVER
ncbi:MAG: UvrD-helicase domain-containing protein [Treponema sp.]|nr:UvrD-helicase domain-containing protein [Treponema sp.]